MKGVIEMNLQTIITIIIMLGIVILAIVIASGALGPLEELASKASIENILKIFGIGGQ